VAYRTLPTFNWGLAVKVDQAEALKGTLTLAAFLTAAGTALAVGAAIIAFFLAQRLTHPIISVSKRVSRLGPGHWGFRSMVRTGDEVEILDRVAADLAARLKRTYENLEEEVKERTKELKKQYAKDRAILESVAYGIVTVDRTGVIVDVNPAAARLLGRDTKQLISRSVDTVMPLCKHRTITKKAVHPVIKALRTRKSFRADTNAHINIVRKDETFLPVSIVVTPLVERQKLLGAVIVFQDMTEERRVDYIKSEFISLASHQLRTPLSSLQWYLELLSGEKNANLTTIQKESMREMQHAVQRMARLIETLLHASRLEGGEITPKMQKVNLTTLLRDIVGELQSLSKDKKLSCVADLPLQSITLETDPILLNVVFQNLFNNVMKYSKEGGEVELRCTKTKSVVKISVRDTGIGIPKKDQSRVFERLFRASNAISVDTDGSGLGLFISKMIIETIGGSISFESEENKGATFTIKFPLKSKRRKAKSP